MPWTKFADMHSGGRAKEDFEYLFIEAPEAEAKIIFYNRFGHTPERVTCACCGDDYSIDESETLAKATAYYRGCAYDRQVGYVERADTKYGRAYLTLEQYVERREGIGMSRGRVEFIFADDIKPEERVGNLPRQGYVWCD